MIFKLLIILSIIFSLILITAHLAHASYKISVKIEPVNSYSPTVKVKVKLDNGPSESRTVDLGAKADYYDDSEIFLSFKFKHSPEYQYKVCLDHNCGYFAKENHLADFRIK